MDLMRSLQTFYNKILAGTQRLELMQLWTTGRAALIPKFDEEASHIGWRPISIGDCLYRHFGRTVLAKLNSDYTTHRLHRLRSLQLGINTSGGCEIGARLAQVCFDLDCEMSVGDDTMCLIKVDIANAFPTIPRRDIFDALKEYAPALCHPFKMLYGHSSRLYTSQGAMVGQCHTGVRQGCPLAMLFFAVGFHPTLSRIHDAIQEIKTENGSTAPAGAFGYADDVNAYVGARCVHQAAERISDIIQESRMHIKPSKCTILVQKGLKAQLESFPHNHGFSVTDEGVTVLGNPVGSEEFRRVNIQQKMARMAAPLTVLDMIHPQIAFVLMTSCINAQPQYLSRVTEPHLFWNAAELFDQAIDNGIGLIMNSTPKPTPKSFVHCRNVSVVLVSLVFIAPRRRRCVKLRDKRLSTSSMSIVLPTLSYMNTLNRGPISPTSRHSSTPSFRSPLMSHS
jgi:hypothetical protein